MSDETKDCVMASEPAPVYGVINSSASFRYSKKPSERVLQHTMSVDEYFEKLISIVRKDYEAL